MSIATPEPDFNALSEVEQQAVAERLLKIEQSGWKPFWCPDPRCDGMPHRMMLPSGDIGLDPQWGHNHARVDQRLPPWQRAWVRAILSGRGGGKTTTGLEFVALSARRGINGAIIGRRGTEIANTHVAGLIERAHPEFQPEYHASKDLIVWPNGAITYLFSGERPENIRSINVSYAWLDEFAWMEEIETIWMNIRLATRIETPENPIHILLTSTPRGTPFLRKIEDDPDIEVVRVSTYANRANLSKDFIREMEKEYEGTRMGRQEIHGEVLRDVEGAFWNDDMYTHLRLETAEEFEDLLETMDDRVLAVDPAGSKGPRSDATGIIGMGVQRSETAFGLDRGFVLGDATLKGSPDEWAAQTFKAARLWRVNRIIVERNFGGDMVIKNLRDYALANPGLACDETGQDFRIVEKRAVQGKETRVEPLVGQYERKMITHVTSPNVFGDLSELEKEQTAWVPKSRGGKSPSPNRIDACLAEGTLVVMGDGVTEKPIETIQSGELVMTRQGPKRVAKTWIARTDAEVIQRRTPEGRTLWATPDHKVWTDNPDRWIRFDSDASVWGRILTWSTQTQQANLTQWCGSASHGNATREDKDNELTGSTTQPLPSATSTGDVSENFIERCIYALQAISRKVFTFTTRTSTRSTTTRATLKHSRRRNTQECIQGTSTDAPIGLSTLLGPQRERSERTRNEPPSALKQVANSAGSASLSDLSPVPSAETLSSPNQRPPLTAQRSASDSETAEKSESATQIEATGCPGCASCAEASSRCTTGTKSNVNGQAENYYVPYPALPEAGLRIEPRVWDMEVEDAHEFFAEGVLVHNCAWTWIDLKQAVIHKADAASAASINKLIKRRAS